jgi:hypothetical protein
MKLRVRLLVETDDGAPPITDEVACLERETLRPEDVGLSLAEAKDVLQRVQQMMVAAQVSERLAQEANCPDCGQPRRQKGAHTIVVRTLFGTLRVRSPRLYHCRCQPHPTQTFSPLAVALSERSTPELRYLEAKFAGLLSYGVTAKLLAEILPLGRSLHAQAVRAHVHAVATRLESELGDEQPMFIDGCQAEWDELPRPDLPLTVGLDGGYVHSSAQTSRSDGWFAVVAGKSMPAEGDPKCFGFVQRFDTKPKRRLFEVLRSQGMQMNQQVTFVTDGGEDVRDLPLYLNPQAEHLLDWFHVTMRLTVMGQYAKSLPLVNASAAQARALTSAPNALGDHELTDNEDEDEEDEGEEELRPMVTQGEATRELERLKWFLWHGNVFRALQVIEDLEDDLEIAGLETSKLAKALREFGGYIRANGNYIPNYGERYRNDETISSAFVESTVNQVVSKRMVKKQQMRWTPRGAHFLLPVRTRVLNDDLPAVFRRWYPGFQQEADAPAAAA